MHIGRMSIDLWMNEYRTIDAWYRWVDEWMSGQRDGWVSRLMNDWMDGRIHWIDKGKSGMDNKKNNRKVK